MISQERQKMPGVCRSMYGLLMLLPQSTAFKTLHARLHSVPALALLQLDQHSTAASSERGNIDQKDAPASCPFKHLVDYPAMLSQFRQLQVTFCWVLEAKSMFMLPDARCIAKRHLVSDMSQHDSAYSRVNLVHQLITESYLISDACILSTYLQPCHRKAMWRKKKLET